MAVSAAGGSDEVWEGANSALDWMISILLKVQSLLHKFSCITEDPVDML